LTSEKIQHYENKNKYYKFGKMKNLFKKIAALAMWRYASGKLPQEGEK